MSDDLFQRIPAAARALLKAVSNLAEKQGVVLYIVGGFVRDLKLGISSTDYDLVVVGDAVKLARALRKSYGGDLRVHKRFGTANWTVTSVKSNLVQTLQDFADEAINISELPELLDFVTARSESYTQPAALPKVQPGDMQADLARRDFTVNTFALPLSEAVSEILSVPEAQQDLDQGLIRVLHDQSFIDDPTRIFRAVRYEQRLGFEIEPHTLELLQAALPYIAELSGDRIRHELDHIILEVERIAILERLDDLGVLAAIDQDLVLNATVRAGLGRLPGDTENADMAYVTWLAYLPQEDIQRIAARLQFSTELTEASLAASKLKSDLPDLSEASPSQLVKCLEHVPDLALKAMTYVLEDANQKRLVENYLNDWVDIKARADGHTLKERGLEPGPRYKEILTTLRSAWLDGEVSTPEEEEVLLERLLND
ncbi:MAG: CCA tRNA nucleotidyltransferase [Chloroflexi bacterium]|nr:CCA tRNA nucleotidyltransferase [Chloroflexota bacterium]